MRNFFMVAIWHRSSLSPVDRLFILRMGFLIWLLNIVVFDNEKRNAFGYSASTDWISPVVAVLHR